MISAFTSFRSISFLPCVTILMAELLVSLLGEQLGSILFRELEQEVRLVVGVEEEVQKLKSNLSAIQAVLADAETRQVKEAAVRDWSDKLKDIAYDIMDVRDDWEVAILSSQSKPGDELNKPERKVCSFLQSSCFCCKQAALRHDIARKIEGLNQKLDLLAQEKERYKFVSTEANRPIERSMTVSMIEITEVKGREEDKDKLVERLLSESSGGEGSELRVVSIVGMGGIGKTTLAQFAFNHDRIKAYFGDNKFWVCVSDPFDEIRVANAIYTGLLGSPPDVKELEDILRKIGESIKDKRFLLILDDVWEENRTKWDRLKQCLKHGLSGSKVLITTRNEKVASVMNCSEDYVVRVRNLRDEECWSILSKIAFFARSDIERKDLEENFSKEMSKKCKGLPLAAKTLGGILQFRKTKEEWQSILSSEVWELEEGEKDVIGPIWLSYYDLSPALKRCFSYCAVFPKDHLIMKHQLIEMWMAQGYLQPTRSNNLEVHGEIYFQNLVMRSFFQKVEKDYYRDESFWNFKMHDMVHDVAQMVARNECCSTQTVDDRVELIRTSRHLYLDLPSHGSRLNSCHGLKKKRSLLLYWKPATDELSSLFGELLHVRSLSLTNGDFEGIPPSIRKLVQLRWLVLSANYKLKQLPAALCELHSLQTLDVSDCYKLKQLPLGIGKLINLRHLHNLGGPTELPKGIAELTGLRTLDEVDVRGDGDAFSLGDLKNLNELRGRLLIRGLGARDRHVGEAKQAELKKKAHITRLDLCFSFRENEEEGCTPRNEELLLEAFEPSPNLEILSIYYYGGTTFPGWMISLTNLKSIILGSCESCDRLPSMGKLPSLETLELHHMSGVKKVGVELLGIETQIGVSKSDTSASSSSPPPSSPVVVAFPKLTTLKFWYMDSWQEWDDYYYDNNHCDGTIKPPASIMPSLRSLKIIGCPRLKALSDYILQNTKLQSLKIRRSDLLQERYNKEKGEDWSKISHISRVTLYPLP